MNDAEIARRAESIRAAFAAARFDERTPDEAGFAQVFESEIKPKLLEQVDDNLKIAAERARRKRIANFMTFPLLPLTLLLFVPLLAPLILPQADPTALQASFPRLAGIVVGGNFLAWGLIVFLTCVQVWARWMRPHEKDPNQEFAMRKLLERFGWQLSKGSGFDAGGIADSPIKPLSDAIIFRDDLIAGSLDGRVPFKAWRAVTRVKSGKNGSRTTFRGWYLRAELPFSFEAVTFVRERAGEYQTTRLSRGVGLEEVRLEDPDFARAFAVASNDQHEARVILPPDVMHHLTAHVGMFKGTGALMLGFAGRTAHLWMPWNRTELSDWKPFDPAGMIEDMHESFAELSAIRGFLRDIDVIAESEGFRAQAAQKTD